MLTMGQLSPQKKGKNANPFDFSEMANHLLRSIFAAAVGAEDSKSELRIKYFPSFSEGKYLVCLYSSPTWTVPTDVEKPSA